MFVLEAHGPDTFVGIGPRYPWGGLYGGQIVAQSLIAAANTVDDRAPPHSLRAYFIRRGDHTKPIRYEVDRIRDGRSFTTRRVVARQATGAILNLEASFHAPAGASVIVAAQMPTVPSPDDLPSDSWSAAFERRIVPVESIGPGRATAWFRVDETSNDDDWVTRELLEACWLAYVSDDLPADTVVSAHPVLSDPAARERAFVASLDHTIWFHRSAPVGEWQLHDFRCEHFVEGRGLTIGHVFSRHGAHLATVAQEVLVRDSGARE